MAKVASRSRPALRASRAASASVSAPAPAAPSSSEQALLFLEALGLVVAGRAQQGEGFSSSEVPRLLAQLRRLYGLVRSELRRAA